MDVDGVGEDSVTGAAPPAPARRKERKGRASPLLLIGAIVGVALGYVFYSKSSRPVEITADSKVQRYLKRQTVQPHVIKGVLTTSLDTSLATAPPGLIIGLNNGKYGVQALSTENSRPLYESTAEDDLNKMLTAMVEVAAKESGLANSDSNHLILTVGTMGSEMQTGVGNLRLGPKQGEDQAHFLKGRTDAIRALARNLVASLKTFTKQICMKPGGVPPGYQVTAGKEPVSDLRRPIFLLPMDEAKVKDGLIRSIQYLIEPTVTGIPDRPFTHFWVRGPISIIEFDLPRLTSKQFPTPMDLARAQLTVINQRAEEAANQLSGLNAQPRKK